VVVNSQKPEALKEVGLNQFALTARGNVYSFMNNKWKSACNDWKVSKKLGDEQARDNFRNFKC